MVYILVWFAIALGCCQVWDQLSLELPPRIPLLWTYIYCTYIGRALGQQQCPGATHVEGHTVMTLTAALSL